MVVGRQRRRNIATQSATMTTPTTKTSTSEKKNIEKVLTVVEKELKKSSNPTKAVEMQRYVKTDMPMYGIQKPQRQRIEKLMYEQIAQTSATCEQLQDCTILSSSASSKPPKNGSLKKMVMTVTLYEEYVTRLWKMSHRENKYLAIDFATHFTHCITFDSLSMYESMLREEYMWWDLCDPIAVNLVGSLARDCSDYSNREEQSDAGLTILKPMLKEWIQDDNMWIRRTAILCQLKSKTKTDETLLFDLCRRCLDEKEFFIQKAIGWALREYGKTNPSSVIAFLEQEKESLSRLSFREGSRILISKGLMTV
jgi:3-methyladenine DNA glycosylase AlkD